MFHKKQSLDPAGSEIFKWQVHTWAAPSSAKEEPKWETEPVPVVRASSTNESNKWKILETDDWHVCLYFSPGTERPLNVSSAQSICFPHVPTANKEKKKIQKGLLRNTGHKAYWSNITSAWCHTSTSHGVSSLVQKILACKDHFMVNNLKGHLVGIILPSSGSCIF
jgi:hypothetical protein